MEVWGNNLKHISVSNQYILHLKLTPCCVLILHSWTWKIGIRGQATALSASGHWGKLTAACSEEQEQKPPRGAAEMCAGSTLHQGRQDHLRAKRAALPRPRAPNNRTPFRPQTLSAHRLQETDRPRVKGEDAAGTRKCVQTSPHPRHPDRQRNVNCC